MTEAYEAVPVPGSRRQPLAGAQRVAAADAGAEVLVTVVLRRGVDEPGQGADPDDIEQVVSYARDAGLEVVASSEVARSVRLRGTVAAMNEAFGVDLGTYQIPEGPTYRGREGSVYIPEQLDGVVITVLGLDARPQARAHFRIAGATAGVLAPHARGTGASPVEIAAAYGFPTDVDGAGQTVAVIELGGGFRPEDLDAYFSGLGLATPSVEAVGVDGAGNAPGDDADGEVMLDIEVIGAVAPGAAIAVYFAPNTTDGFYDAIAAAINDDTRLPAIISISWGQAESGWTASQLDAYDALLADAVAAGVAVYVAAGDNGASDGDTDGSLHVDFPASSPNAVACGGTTLTLADGAIASETVWNELASGDGATGGGFSHHFGLPDYQKGVVHGGDGRGVPDVAANADPLTGYNVRVDGQDLVIGGTSAVAPLWAGLTALANQRAGGSVGAPHAALYGAAGALRDIMTGNNNGYAAGLGWDACTGLGSPDGEKVIATLLGPPPGEVDEEGGGASVAVRVE